MVALVLGSHTPGVDVHAEGGLASDSELDEVAEDKAPSAEVHEPLEERRARQHALQQQDRHKHPAGHVLSSLLSMLLLVVLSVHRTRHLCIVYLV